MTNERERKLVETLETAKQELAWLKDTATDSKDRCRVVGYEDCLRLFKKALSLPESPKREVSLDVECIAKVMQEVDGDFPMQLEEYFPYAKAIAALQPKQKEMGVDAYSKCSAQQVDGCNQCPEYEVCGGHPDDLAVDKFATAMKKKLAKKRLEGRGGWEDPSQCDLRFLWQLLHEHVAKGDLVDIGNLAMMIWNREAALTPKAGGG